MRGANLAVVVALGLGIAVLSGFSRPLRAESPANPFHAIQDEVRAALRWESQAKTFAQRSAAVCELVELHRALVTHSRFPNSETMHGYRNQVASRLLQVQADVKRQVRREQFSAAKAGPPKRDPPTPEYVGRADELSDSLAEQHPSAPEVDRLHRSLPWFTGAHNHPRRPSALENPVCPAPRPAWRKQTQGCIWVSVSAD